MKGNEMMKFSASGRAPGLPRGGRPGFKRIGGARYQTIRPVLPVERYVESPGRFHFGIPWPWEEFTEATRVMSATGDETQIASLAQVYCPRADGEVVSWGVWSEQGEFDALANARSIATQFAQIYHGTVVGTRAVLLGGARTLIVNVATATQRIDRVSTEWHDRILYGEYRSPILYADAYAAHLETILGTWVWG